MYDQTARISSQRKSTQLGRKTQGSTAYRQDQVRLLQLLICLVLFLAVFIGKGVFPTKLIQLRSNIMTMISSDADFQSAFSNLGESLSGEEGTLLDTLGSFCVEVFGPGGTETEVLAPSLAAQTESLLTEEIQFLSHSPDQQALAAHFLTERQEDVLTLQPIQTVQGGENEAAEPPAAIAAAGTVLMESDYSGQDLPVNYTMDLVSLGELETITPVLGHINSEYGYRDHPINGNYQFHGGVDIGGQTGDPISAFAAGTVEYVGEDDSYGLYLQLDHGNGVKSFYAHCSTICVTKGQTVALGEKIAEVGSTGAATGPHLHLELKYNSTHLNPIYYIEYLTDQ